MNTGKVKRKEIVPNNMGSRRMILRKARRIIYCRRRNTLYNNINKY